MTPIATLSEVLGHPDELQPYQDPAVAYTHRDEIRRVLDPLIRQSTTEEWVTRLRERAIWCAPVNELAATFDDEAVRFLDPVLEFEHPEAGTVRVLRHPVRYGSGRAGLTRQPPSVGEHTREVLEEAGCSAEEVAAAMREGA
jgi:crotonobetainyl-CoA:carnitine CoA-transferase CaiB-like acyl-CoA transferase